MKNYVKKNYSQPVNTLEELEKWIDSIYEYISGAGLEYIEEYKFLPNVLRLIDSEMDNPNRTWVSIRGGGFQKYTNVLLVAKLCSDTQLGDKISFIEDIVNHPEYPNYDNGMEYWSPFMKVLKDVKPKYLDFPRIVDTRNGYIQSPII